MCWSKYRTNGSNLKKRLNLSWKSIHLLCFYDNQDIFLSQYALKLKCLKLKMSTTGFHHSYLMALKGYEELYHGESHPDNNQLYLNDIAI